MLKHIVPSFAMSFLFFTTELYNAQNREGALRLHWVPFWFYSSYDMYVVYVLTYINYYALIYIFKN